MAWLAGVFPGRSTFTSSLIVLLVILVTHLPRSRITKSHLTESILNYGDLTADFEVAIQGVFYVLCKVVYNLYLHPLRKYPGPKLWAISRLPFSYTWLSGRAHKKIYELHRQYGDVVRIAPNELIFGYPEAFNDIMGHRRRGQEENGKDPDFWHGNDLTLVGSNRERHARLRKVLSHAFSAQAMMDQEPIFRQYVTLMIDRMKTACERDAAQEMTAWYNWVTFDMVGDLAFGEPFGCLQETRSHPWVKLIFKNIQRQAVAVALSKYPLANTLAKLMTPKEVLRDVRTHHEFTEAQVAKRFAFTEARPDFMESMIKARDKSQISHPEILANAHNLIVGGSETTATVLAGATYLLSINKPALRKLHDELRANYQSQDEIDLLSVQKLQYMMAVLHEALRLYPPVPSAIPRITPPGGTTIRGEHIPPNTTLGIWPWPMFHNPDFFRDAESFVPERWLGDPRFDGDQKEALQPFSVGPRNCIGKNLAYAEMRLILARVVWNFDFEPDPRSEGWLEKNVLYFLWVKPELYVRLIPRAMA